MRRVEFSFVGLVTALIVGCSTNEGVASCDASIYQSLIGANIAAVSLPASLDHRIVGSEEDVITFGNTLIIAIDKHGVVQSVNCA